MKQNRHLLFVLSFLLLLTFRLLPVSAAAQTTEEIQEVWINGLLESETLRLYPLAVSGKWEETVGQWLEEGNAPQEIRGFEDSPDILFRLQPETQDRLAQLLARAMGQTGDDALFLEDMSGSFIWNADTKNWEGRLDSGGYLLYPSSSQRIFSPRLLLVSDEKVELSYQDKYVADPSFEMPVFAVETGLSMDEGFLVQGRQLLVRTALNPEEYPPFFPSQNKLVRVLSYCFGPGQTPALDKAQVQDADLGFALEEGRDYTLESFSGVRLYVDESHTGCFYEDNGLFYFLDGSAAGKTTLEETLESYNQRYGTALTPESLQCVPSSTVVVLTLGQWKKPLEFLCYVDVGNTYTPQAEGQVDRGIALLQGQYHFTASLNPADPMGRLVQLRQYTNYGIEALLLDGGVAGAGGVQAGKPLPGGVFSLYRLRSNRVFSEDADQAQINAWVQEAVALNPGQGYQVLWFGNEARLYLFQTSQVVNAQGIAGFGALDRGEYLLVETIPPDGYASVRTAYQITDVAWDNAAFQQVTWRNYTGVYLPETGGLGTQQFTMLGTAILMAGLFLMIWTIQRKKETEL